MLGSKKRIEKRKLTYEKLASDFVQKMDRCENKELIEKLGEVYDALNGQALTVNSVEARKDKKVKAQLSKILMINDSTYVDVKERFNKDCQSVISTIVGGTGAGYQLTMKEKRAKKQRVLTEEKRAQLDEAVKNVEKYADEIIAIDEEISACNTRIRREKDDTKAAIILREKKGLERRLNQKIKLKEQNDRVITLAESEEYVEQLKKINESFDLKRMTKNAQEMARLQEEQRINDRLYDKITSMTDTTLTSSGVSDSELAELRAIREKAVKEEKEQVFERSEEIITQIEEDYEDELEVEELT